MQRSRENWILTVGSNWDRNPWLATNIVVVASLLLVKLLNENVGYANGTGCDSWYFFGIYQDYFHLRSILGDEYQLDRFAAILPWILLGPHLSATALTEAKFWTYFLVSSGCFSYAAVTLFGARTGPLISILFAGSTLFMGALSTDFVTGAGLAWESALIAATIRAAKSDRSAPWLLLTGVLNACCVYTHIPMVMFIFSIPLYLLLRAPMPTTKDLAQSVVLILVGFLGMSIVLGLASLELKGNFMFFKNEVLSTILYVGHTYYGKRGIFEWFSYESNVPVFLLAAGASAWTLFQVGIGRALTTSRVLLIPPMVYLAVAILCFGFEFSGRLVLQENVFAPWMFPTAFLAIGSALYLVEIRYKSLSIPLSLAAAVVLVWAAYRANPNVGYWWRYALAAGALISLALPFGAWSSTAARGCIIALLAITYPTGYGSLPWWPARLTERNFYELVKRAHQFVTSHSSDTRPSFWVSGDIAGIGDPLFVSIAAPRSFLECGGFAASYPSPHIRHESWNEYFLDLSAAAGTHYISAGRPLFIIARGQDLVASASDAFLAVGLTATRIDEIEIAPGISIAAAEIK
jgi:hypothetical protein